MAKKGGVSMGSCKSCGMHIADEELVEDKCMDCAAEKGTDDDESSVSDLSEDTEEDK